MAPGTLHERIVKKACKDGWQRGNWRKPFLATCGNNPMWQGEIESSDGRALIADMTMHPDAWRLIVEGPDTPEKEWGYPVLVLEFLEVEITHPMPLLKREDYRQLWRRFDATSCFHFRVYRSDRYVPMMLWLDTGTAYEKE